MRVGVFGGTFDPVHVGHLIFAEQARDQAGLDLVRFIPAARPPHKPDHLLTHFDHRAEMLSLALAGNSAFLVDQCENARAGPSYTVDTLESLHHAMPEAAFCLLVGSDCLPDLVHWRAPRRIAELAELVVMPRPGWSVDSFINSAPGRALEGVLRLRQLVDSPQVEIASHDLRLRIASGRSVRYLVPRAVECYISTHRLYRPSG
jgi:nicotinate-nucleotide adenylyltransferase